MNKEFYPASGTVLYQGVTGSGLPVCVFPKEEFQTRYAFFAVRYGGCDRRFLLDGNWLDTPAGIAHFLEHKMFDMPGYNALEKLTAMGASPNAFTSHGMTGYLFSCTDGFYENLEELLRFVMTPCFSPESVEKEQGIIGQEIRMGEDSPARRVQQNLLRALYSEHPARDSIAGTVESIAQISADTLYDCHRMFYHPGNMVLCCAGDMDAEKVLELADRVVTTPAGETALRDYGREESLLPNQVRIEDKMSVSMPLFRLGAKLPREAEGGDWARSMLVASLACELLLGEGTPLYNAMYQDGVINKSFYAGAFDFPGGGVCCAGGRCADPGAVLGRIVDGAEAFRMDRAAEKRLSGLKKKALGDFLMALDSLDDLCHSQADGYLSGWQHMDFPGICGEISGEEVERFLHETLQAQRLAISVVSPGS